MKQPFQILIFLAVLWLGSGCIHTYPDSDAEDPTLVEVRLHLNFPETWDIIDHSAEEKSRLASDPDLRIVGNLASSGKNTYSFKTYADRASLKDGIDLTLPSKVVQQEYTLKIWVDYSDSEDDEGLCYDISDLSAVKYIHPHGERKSYDDCFSVTTKWTPLSIGNENKTENTEITLIRPTARFRLVADDYSQFINIHEKDIRRGESYIVKISYLSPIAERYNLYEDIPVNPRNEMTFTNPLEILTIEGVEVELASDLLFVSEEPSSIIINLTVLNSTLLPIASISGIEIPLERGKITTVRGKLLTNLLSTGITIDNEWSEEVEIFIDNQSEL